MHFGGDYYPEQWPEEVWPQDVSLMREAGVDLVRVGVFARSRIQPQEGEFDFGWLDRVLDLLHDAGIGVVLATATASPPQWLTHRYPDVLPRTADGTILYPGSRQHYATTAPDYRRLAAALVTQIAQRYAQHPAVQLWNVNNEYACHVHYDYSDNAAAAFRVWLQKRYADVAALNEAWGTTFWSQIYSSFEEVLPPRTAPYSHNPSALLDFRRFTSDAALELFTAERDIIRAAGARHRVTTNFMGAFKPLDYWRWAAEVDVVSDDSYPDPRDPESFRASAFTQDLMRSLKPGQPWILMEQASDAVNWRANNAAKAPGQLAALSWQAVARGAEAVMFFQWRQSRAGSEKFHSAMLPHGGTGTRTWREVVALGRSLAGQPPRTPAPGRVAIVLDWENWWALDQPDHPVTFDYLQQIRTWYDALHRLGIRVDLIPAAADPQAYALVLAPALYLLDAASAANLNAFVAGGGILVTTAFTDVVDEHDRFRDGGFGTQLRAVLGARILGFTGIDPVDGRHVQTEAAGAGFTPQTFQEELEVETATVLARFDDGTPALLENRLGQGVSLHLATFTDAAGASSIVATALDLAGVVPAFADLPDGVEAIDGPDGTTLINHSGTAVVVPGRSRPLPPFAVVEPT